MGKIHRRSQGKFSSNFVNNQNYIKCNHTQKNEIEKCETPGKFADR